MRYHASLTIPAGTPASSPASNKFSVSAGRITEMELLFPPGSAGRAYLQIFYRDRQIYPTSIGEYFRGDDHLINWSDEYDLADSPFELELRGWGPDTTYNHTIYCQCTISPREPATALDLSAAPAAALETEA